MQEAHTDQDSYPRLSRRVRAVLIDAIVTPVCAVGTLFLARSMGLDTTGVVLATLSVIFILEPVLVSLTGGTAGHHLNGLRIKNADTGQNINLIASSARYIVKVVLGAYSLLSMWLTKRYQALHDMASNSVVVLRNPESFGSHEVLAEKDVGDNSHQLRLWSRRIAFIVLYNVLWFLIFDVVTDLFISEACLYSHRCSVEEEWFAAGSVLSWVMGAILLIVLCARGLMPGCSRVKSN